MKAYLKSKLRWFCSFEDEGLEWRLLGMNNLEREVWLQAFFKLYSEPATRTAWVWCKLLGQVGIYLLQTVYLRLLLFYFLSRLTKLDPQNDIGLDAAEEVEEPFHARQATLQHPQGQVEDAR